MWKRPGKFTKRLEAQRKRNVNTARVKRDNVWAKPVLKPKTLFSRRKYVDTEYGVQAQQPDLPTYECTVLLEELLQNLKKL
ncbi:hypothetical protein PR048_012690 [Dryococelus australis]|uniref:Uncharacterized protein n=1 Tax=Dryococelus australis TaxID=614101 RepID=A0ABQ9HQU3_9NEOP|nr:hypothetical protein PR048_012690 [Dryococelus australis]